MTAPLTPAPATAREPVRRYGALDPRVVPAPGPAPRFARTAPTVRGRVAQRARYGAFGLGVAPATPKGGGA